MVDVKTNSRNRRSKYGEKTVAIRVPESMVPVIEDLLRGREVIEQDWCRVVLPPVAQELVRFIADRLVEPQLSILDAIRDQDSEAFRLLSDELMADIARLRSDYGQVVARGLIESVTGGDAPGLKVLLDKKNEG